VPPPPVISIPVVDSAAPEVEEGKDDVYVIVVALVKPEPQI